MIQVEEHSRHTEKIFVLFLKYNINSKEQLAVNSNNIIKIELFLTLTVHIFSLFVLSVSYCATPWQ